MTSFAKTSLVKGVALFVGAEGLHDTMSCSGPKKLLLAYVHPPPPPPPHSSSTDKQQQSNIIIIVGILVGSTVNASPFQWESAWP